MGFTWVPWFLMLSGFVLAHASLARGGGEQMSGEGGWASAVACVKRRGAGVYPLYFVVLLVSVCVALMQLSRKSASEMKTGPASAPHMLDALCHLPYPVSAAHTSIFRMDSHSTSY
ncbi:hypothetical protein T484DRAFT_1788210 [Baffinella frigidus]|nr:hypothetical protein T484DRAFT_1788210 [Cryptophyta sp. CCMP2293]